jgi:hypothetical protein
MTKIDSKIGAAIHYRSLLENEWLGQWDLMKDGKLLRPTVTIKSLEPYVPPQRKKFRQPDGSYKLEPIKRYIVEFEGKRKRWLSGPVTQRAIAGMYGNDLRAWIGQKITLYVDESVQFGRTKTGGIRVVNTKPVEAPTDEPLDNSVDLERASIIAEAFADAEEEKGI